MKACDGRVMTVVPTWISRPKASRSGGVSLHLPLVRLIKNDLGLLDHLAILHKFVASSLHPSPPPCSPHHCTLQMVPGTWKTLKCSLNGFDKCF